MSSDEPRGLTLLAGLRPEGMPTAPPSLGVVPKVPFPRDPRDPRPRGRSKLALELGDALQKALDGATVSVVPSSKRMVERIRIVAPAPPPQPTRPVQKDPGAWRNECLARGVCAWCERPVPPGKSRCALHARKR